MQLRIGTRKLNDGIMVVDCAGRIVFGDETAALRDRVGNSSLRRVGLC